MKMESIRMRERILDWLEWDVERRLRWQSASDLIETLRLRARPNWARKK